MRGLAGAIRRRQEAHLAEWRRRGLRARAEDVRRHGMGATLDRVRKVEDLLNMALGVFTSAGVVHSSLSGMTSVADLLGLLLEDFEVLAKEKGGMAQLLFEKR